MPTNTPTAVEVANLMAFITAPTGVVSQPYVLLSAYGATSTDGFAEIRGKVGLVDFTCPGTQCLVTVLSDNTVTLPRLHPVWKRQRRGRRDRACEPGGKRFYGYTQIAQTRGGL